MWVHRAKDISGQVIGIRPIEPVLHPNGVEWKKIFDVVFARYRSRLTAVVGNFDDARWTSYGLSYQALRGAAKLGRYSQHAYTFKACVNAHKKYLGRAERWGRHQRQQGVEVGHLPEGFGAAYERDVDLRLDFEEALGKMGGEDAAICRWHLVEGYNFAEIGELLGGMHRSTVQRRFGKCLESLRVALRAYEPAGEMAGPIAEHAA